MASLFLHIQIQPQAEKLNYIIDLNKTQPSTHSQVFSKSFSSRARGAFLTGRMPFSEHSYPPHPIQNEGEKNYVTHRWSLTMISLNAPGSNRDIQRESPDSQWIWADQSQGPNKIRVKQPFQTTQCSHWKSCSVGLLDLDEIRESVT